MEQIIEALKENAEIISYCLSTQNPSSDNDGCYGYPAMILICSVIDTIGSFFSGAEMEIQVGAEKKKIEKNSDHFFILNHEELFGFQYLGVTLYDFYTNYRSRLTHSNALPKNHFLKYDPEDDQPFSLDAKNKIECVNLHALNENLKGAIETFSHWLETRNWSSDHVVSKDLKSRGRNSPPSISQNTSLSGHGETHGSI